MLSMKHGHWYHGCGDLDTALHALVGWSTVSRPDLWLRYCRSLLMIRLRCYNHGPSAVSTEHGSIHTAPAPTQCHLRPCPRQWLRQSDLLSSLAPSLEAAVLVAEDVLSMPTLLRIHRTISVCNIEF